MAEGRGTRLSRLAGACKKQHRRSREIGSIVAAFVGCVRDESRLAVGGWLGLNNGEAERHKTPPGRVAPIRRLGG